MLWMVFSRIHGSETPYENNRAGVSWGRAACHFAGNSLGGDLQIWSPRQVSYVFMHKEMI